MDRAGVSVFISAVFFIGISLAAITLALNIALPQIQTMEDTSSIENNIEFLTQLDEAIQTVASGSQHGKRELVLHFERGQYRFDTENTELYYELETDSPIISTHSSRFMGPVELRANTDVSVEHTTVDGTDCWQLENDRVRTCIRDVNDTVAGTVNTSQMLVRFHNKAQETVLNGSMYVQINKTRATRANVSKTFVPDTGSALSNGQITAQVDTANNGRYNVTYELLSGADFLAVRADAPNVTTGLRFVIDDAGTDIVYIDGSQRSAGVYGTDILDFGYGIGQGNQLFGGVVAGNGFTRIGYGDAVSGGRYEINVTQTGDSIALIPFTEGGLDAVEDREDVIRDGVIGRLFSYPSPNFGYTLNDQKTIRAVLSYDHIVLDGLDRTLAPGTHQLLVEHNGVTSGQANISVSAK